MLDVGLKITAYPVEEYLSEIERLDNELEQHFEDKLSIQLSQNNVDLCLFNLNPEDLKTSKYSLPESYVALGELKGGIDPAGADEHWKTAGTSLGRIHKAFSKIGYSPSIFFVGAAVEKKMATEIWNQLKDGTLNNAANLNEEKQIASVSNWLCTL